MNREEIRRLFPAAEKAAQAVAGVINTALPPGYGFALLAFSFGEGGYLTHVSNANRADLVRVLREAADKIERNVDQPPGIVGQAD